MNIFNLLDQFNIDDETLEKKGIATSRRESFKQLGSIGKKLAAAAVPFGLATASSTKAFAQASGEMTAAEVLQFALLLENLEAEFYAMGIAADGLIPAGREQEIFAQISKHETAHMEFLKTTLTSLGETPAEKPTFDFTVGGAFDPFGDYPTFLALAQAFEDTGVRTYKGQAGNLKTDGTSDNVPLTAALSIHGVEARHASEVRRLRGLKGWIILNQRGEGMPEQTQAVYNGEEVTDQAGYDTSSEFDAEAGSASFDEPLTKAEVEAIAGLFIVA